MLLLRFVIFAKNLAMKKICLTILMFCATITLSFAQEFEISRGKIYLGERQLGESEARLLLGDDVYDNIFIPAVRQKKVGLGLTIAGGACLEFGATTAFCAGAMLAHREIEPSSSYNPRQDPNYIVALIGTGLSVAGLALLGVGIPSFVIGRKRLGHLEDATNEQLSSKVTLNLSASPYGLCLRLVY